MSGILVSDLTQILHCQINPFGLILIIPFSMVVFFGKGVLLTSIIITIMCEQIHFGSYF